MIIKACLMKTKKILRMNPGIGLFLVGIFILSKPAPAQLLTFALNDLPETSELKLSDIGAMEISYIPLETSDVSRNISINKAIFTKSHILIHFYNEIYLFRTDGSFVTRIGSVGKGPGEFTTAHSVDIDARIGTVYVADGWQKKYLVFDLEGNFVRSFKAPIQAAVDFRLIGSRILSYHFNILGNITDSYILLDTLGKVIRRFPNKYSWKSAGVINNLHLLGENLFYNYNGKIIKGEMYSDTLFTYEAGRFEPYRIIYQGEYRIDPEIRTENSDDIFRKVYIPMNLFECSHYLFYEFLSPDRKETEPLIFIGSNKSDLKVVVNPVKGLTNDLDGGPGFWPKTSSDDNTLVSWVDAGDLKKHIAGEEFKRAVVAILKRRKN